jgi:hypothetical protein
MGAGQAMRIGLTHLDTFSALGAFADTEAFDKKVSLLYLHSGTVGLDANIHKSSKALSEALQQASSKNVIFHDAAGQRHVMRRQLTIGCWHTTRQLDARLTGVRGFVVIRPPTPRHPPCFLIATFLQGFLGFGAFLVWGRWPL